MRHFRLKKIALTALVAASPLTAGNWSDCCGDFYGTIEAIYWQTTHCPIEAATRWTGNENASGERIRQSPLLKSDYEWGVRARVGYETCNMFVDVGYLYFRPTDSIRVKRGDFANLNLPANDTNLELVESSLRFRYQNVDVRYGHYLHNSCGCRYYAYGNARWVDIEFHNKSLGKTDIEGEFDNSYLQEAKFDGGGLGVGLGGHYCIGCGFGVGGSLGVMAIIGDVKLQKQQYVDSGDEAFQFRHPESNTCVIPGLEFRFGIDYSLCWDCFTLTGEVGYELDYYFDALRYSWLGGQAPFGQPATLCHNAGFGGPYFRIGASF